jgi:hypothetical protein
LGFEELGAKVKFKLEGSRARGKGMISFHQLSHNLLFSIMSLSAFVILVIFL